MSEPVRKRRKTKVFTDVVANHFDVFNYEASQFLAPDFLVDEDIVKSRVHVDSKVFALEEDQHEDLESDEDMSDSEEDQEDQELARDQEFELGALWTRPEKEQFFYCLSRYSIHRLDEWHVSFENKSKYEILVYYNVLRTNLRRLQTVQRRKSRLLRWDQFPIAYEMSPEYVKLEEAMANELKDPETIENESESDNTEGLVEYDNWYQRWEPLYSHTRLEELRPVPLTPLRFNSSAQEYIHKLVKRYTRQLLWHTVLPTLEQKSLSKRQLNDEERTEDNSDVLVVHRKKHRKNKKVYPHIVTDEDVSRAVYHMRQRNRNHVSLGECVETTFRKYAIRHDHAKMFQRRDTARQAVIPKLIEYDTMKNAHTEDVHNTTALNGRERKYMQRVYRQMLQSVDAADLVETTPFVEYADDGDTYLATSALDNPHYWDLHDEYTTWCDTRDQQLSLEHENILLQHIARQPLGTKPSRNLAAPLQDFVSTTTPASTLTWFQSTNI